MYLIFICDDDPIFARLLKSKVEACLDSRDKKYEIQVYTDGKELLDKLAEQTPGMIFLDIDMPEISGMDLADRIYQSCVQTNVIFVTNREDLVFQAIHFQPFRFIRKAKLEEELEEAILQLLQKLDRENRVLEIQTKDGAEMLSLKDVYYIESCRHYLMVYHKDGCAQTRDKISVFEKWMTEYGFIRIHRSYLVNVRYIRNIRPTGVELDTGEVLPVSRDKVQEIKKQHMIYLRSFVYADC